FGDALESLGANRECRIGRERARNHRTVDYVQALMNALAVGRLTGVENLPEFIYYAILVRRADGTASKRVSNHEFFLTCKHPLPSRQRDVFPTHRGGEFA